MERIMHSLVVVSVLLSLIVTTVVTTPTSVTVTPLADNVTVQRYQPFTLTCVIAAQPSITSVVSGVRWYRSTTSGAGYGLNDLSSCVADNMIRCNPGNTTDNRGTIQFVIGSDNDATTNLTIHRSDTEDNTTFACSALKSGGGTSITRDIRVTVTSPNSLYTTPIDSASSDTLSSNRGTDVAFTGSSMDHATNSTSQIHASSKPSNIRPTSKTTDGTTGRDPRTTETPSASSPPLSIPVIAGACGVVIIILLTIISCLLWARTGKRSGENTKPSFTNFRLDNVYENYGHNTAYADHESIREGESFIGQLSRLQERNRYQNVPLGDIRRCEPSPLPRSASDTARQQISQQHGAESTRGEPSPVCYARPTPPQLATTVNQFVETSPDQPRSPIYHSLDEHTRKPPKEPSSYSAVISSEPNLTCNTSLEDDALPGQPHFLVYHVLDPGSNAPPDEARGNTNTYDSLIKPKKEDTETEEGSEDGEVSRQALSPVYHVLEPDSESPQRKGENYDYAYATVIKTMAEDSGDDAASEDEDVRTRGNKQDEKLNDTQVEAGMYADVGPTSGLFGSPTVPLDETVMETVTDGEGSQYTTSTGDNKKTVDKEVIGNKKESKKNGLKGKTKKHGKPEYVDTGGNVDKSKELGIGDWSVQDQDSDTLDRQFVDNILYVASADDVVVNDRRFGDIGKFARTAQGKPRLDPF